MGRALDYGPEQVTKALIHLARNGGDVEQTAGELIDDTFQVPADTLTLWKSDTHAEQYRRVVAMLADELEGDAIGQLRQTVRRAGQLQTDLLEAVGKIKNPALMPNALRAISDAKAKSTNELLQLTGRPVSGASAESSLLGAAKALVDAGILQPAAGVSLEPVRVSNQAEDHDDQP